jgi:arginine repressor
MATPAGPGTKAARQARIAAILAREQVHSQEQLAGLLSQYTGMHVTQATLSRDLDELGVVRLRAVGGALVYALPADPGGHGSLAGTGLAGTGLAGTGPSGTGPTGTGQTGTGQTGTGQTGTGPSGPGTGVPERAGPSAGPSASGQAAVGAAAADRGPRAANREAAGPVPSPVPATGASPRLVRYLKELLTSAEASANLVVLRTPAGAAQFLASAIDHTTWPAILGTVAGDDTVLVIARDPQGGESLAEDFRRLAERRR